MKQISVFARGVNTKAAYLKRLLNFSLMNLAKHNTITFDFLEVINELEIADRKFIPLKPLEKDSPAPDLILKEDYINNEGFLSALSTNRSVLLGQITGRPLVISFYSTEWKDYGLAHLTYLNKLQQEINSIGGNVLVICPDEQSSILDEVIWDNNLKLNFYFDQNNENAANYGIYSDHDPAWNKFPGIELNVPLLATYVINNGEIVYSHIDNQLQGPGVSKHLLQNIMESHLLQKSA